MYYGLLSGILWAVDTVILGVALGMSPYVDSAQASFASAFMHDFFAAAVLLVMMAQKGRLKDTLEAAKTNEWTCSHAWRTPGWTNWYEWLPSCY